MTLDFTKAFDRCHIPTLLRKLEKKGVGGRLLRAIEGMYTDAYAMIQVNNTLGKPFRVERGVAQGCSLSPLLFNLYLDDLLQTFRESRKGVPVGCTLLNSFSFADDLALLAPNKATVHEFLTILKTWCEKNFFDINDKSAILRVSKAQPEPDSDSEFSFRDIPLKNVSEIRYLGLSRPNMHPSLLHSPPAIS